MPVEEVRLSAFASGGGCATKIPQEELLRLVGGLGPVATHPHLQVGPGDDAAIWRVDAERSMVLTVDFFAPIVDGPEDFGAVAAANALSDVYAMGGTPLCALAIVAWPGEDVMPASVLPRVLAAGAEVVRAAGAVIVGGHSVRDAEPKYGLAVVGTVHPDRVMTVSAGRPGDVLVLTKRLGTGVVAAATREDRAPAAVTAACIASMRTTNRVAAAVAVAHGVRCATDVTGFGLLGHLRTVALASGCGVEVEAGRLPLLPGVEELVAAGAVPGGSRRNRAFAAGWTRWAEPVSEVAAVAATDAQTSGGLLLATPPAELDGLLGDLTRGGVEGRVVGRLVPGPPTPLRVIA